MATITSSEGGLRGSSELTARNAYEWMYRIRAFETRCQEQSTAGRVAGSVHLCAGQDAIPVGAMSLLQPDEPVMATYRGHGWAIAAGIPLSALLAEICHRADGVNGGRAGSAYLSSPEHGFVGENSIVGAGVPIAAGVALASEIHGKGAATLVSIGDGATNQGATHEGLVLAAAKRLPLVVICENNGWSEMTRIRETVPLENLADRVTAYGIPGRTADGTDPLAVREAMIEAVERARNGGGPTFIELKTIRLWGHYNGDVEHYRPREDKSLAEESDPIAKLRRVLVEDGVTETEIAELERAGEAEIDAAEEFALSSPQPDPATARKHVVAKVADVPRAAGAADESAGEEMTYVLAVNNALRDELASRPEVIVFGEDVGAAGGVFGATRRLQVEFGADRVFDTPIAESAILGSAVGLGLEGFRPVAEIMWADFMLVALDQLVNQAANVRYIAQGARSLPIVVRMQQGVTPGSCAQHSQSLEGVLAHIPGLRVGLPATPEDAYSMLRAAVADDDPCIIVESRALYQVKGPVARVRDASIGGARHYGDGSDVAIISWGRMVHAAREAADALAADGVRAGVLDLRWLSPLHEEAIAAVVKECGRVLVVHEANLTGGFGAEVAARIGEKYFDLLDAPVRRLGAPDVRFPAAPVLQDALLPNARTITAAALDLVRG
jgi:2-oxoisovalerate dehydrogenase E1 component